MKLIALEGAYNVRDLGGYTGADGRRVKSGMLFRAGDLNLLTLGDLDKLAACGIRTVVDFRGKDEIAVAPDRLPETVGAIHQLPIEPGNLVEFGRMMQEHGAQVMDEIYRALVRLAVPQYTEFFRILTQGDPGILFHCSAGKDRTGAGAALILAALGVDHDTIIADYLASNEFLGDKYDAEIAARPELAPLLRVQQSHIVTALQVIDTEFGGIDNYLTETLKVDIPCLRARYLD